MTRTDSCYSIRKFSVSCSQRCYILSLGVKAIEAFDFIRDVGVAGSNPVTPTNKIKVLGTYSWFRLALDCPPMYRVWLE